MRKFFVSTLTAIALALPLGIGGLAVTALATASDANAASAAHHFNTCSVHWIFACHSAHRDKIFDTFRPLFTYSGDYPKGANGADQATYGRLEWVYRTDARGHLGFVLKPLAIQYLRTVFSDSDIQEWNAANPGNRFEYPWDPETQLKTGNYVSGNTDHISPEWRERWENHLEEDERRRAEAAFREQFERDRRAAQLLANEQSLGLRLYQARQALNPLSPDPQIELDFVSHCTESRHGTIVAPDGRLACQIEITYMSGYGGHDTVRETVYLDQLESPTGFQITPIEPFGSLADIEELPDHRQATSDNRSRIVELQEEVTMQEETLQELEPAVARNVQVIEALGNSVGVLSEAVTGIAEDTEKNAAGIALAYALDAPGLSYGKRFAITGALGQFRGESAVGFSGSFKAGEFVLISVGGGFAGSGDSSVTGGKLSATYEW